MAANGSTWRSASILAAGVLSLISMVSTGCQVDVAGQTLPSPYYLQDDVQHFRAGPEFKLTNEAAAMKAYQNGGESDSEEAAR